MSKPAKPPFVASPDQRDKAIQAAAELGSDGNAEAFEQAVRSVPKVAPDERTSPLTQREKFIQAAREAECDETGEALDEALRAIGRARKRPA